MVAAAPARPVEPVSAPKAALEPVAPVASEAPVAAARPAGCAGLPAPAQPAPASESAVAAQDEQAVQRAIPELGLGVVPQGCSVYLRGLRPGLQDAGRTQSQGLGGRAQPAGRQTRVDQRPAREHRYQGGWRPRRGALRQHYNSNNFDASTNKRLVPDQARWPVAHSSRNSLVVEATRLMSIHASTRRLLGAALIGAVLAGSQALASPSTAISDGGPEAGLQAISRTSRHRLDSSPLTAPNASLKYYPELPPRPPLSRG